MYKKEDLKFLNMDVTLTFNNKKVFKIEHELSIEEKIKFMDQFENGVASYMLNILIKWENEKDSLPKDKWNNIKTISKKAWIKRNDERKIIDANYRVGDYGIFGNRFKCMSLVCPATEYGHRHLYTDDNIVKQWFHDLCMKLYREEEQYFRTINPFDIKLKKIKEYVTRYHIYFDNKKVNDIAWNDKSEGVSEEELDIFIDAYEKVEKYIESISNDVKCKIDNIK